VRGGGVWAGQNGGSDVPGRLRQLRPTLYLYDNYPGGIGLSAPLFERREELVQRAQDLVAACDCRAGCPACVGPILSSDEDDASGTTPKSLAQRVLALLVAA